MTPPRPLVLVVFIIALTVVETSCFAVTTNSIGVNFGGDGNWVLASGDVAGIVTQANWNNATAESGVLAELIDANGTATTARVSWNAAFGWHSPVAVTDPDSTLMKGCLNEIANPSGVTLTGFEGVYDVYVYCWGTGGASKKSYLDFRVNGANLVQRRDSILADFTGVYVECTPVQAGHYYLQQDITLTSNDTFTIGWPGNEWGDVSAVQFVWEQEETPPLRGFTVLIR